MDKVMKRLGIKLTHEGQDVILVVQCNTMGSPCGGGHANWLITLRGYALELNLALMIFESNLWKK